jgi:CheY-like chemotaxis protein
MGKQGAATSAQSPPAGRRAGAAPGPVLVVDDDRDIREALQEALEVEGYRVATARNGEEALAVARGVRPGLILLDLFMPVMDGLEFRRRQVADPELAGIPVVVVSAASGLEERVRAMGVAAHLPKPLQVDRLFEEVARHFRR